MTRILYREEYFGLYSLNVYVWPRSKINVTHTTSVLTLFSSDIVLPFFNTRV